MADDGGSSGRLRRQYGMLAPGDVRNCLLALSEGADTLASLFGFRFNHQGEMSGHSLGNLILTALSQMETGFERAVERAGEILATSPHRVPEVPTARSILDKTDEGFSEVLGSRPTDDPRVGIRNIIADIDPV